MRQTELNLSKQDRRTLDEFHAKGHTNGLLEASNALLETDQVQGRRGTAVFALSAGSHS